jgi:protein transport protein SEC61 subunit gamma and related proteins
MKKFSMVQYKRVWRLLKKPSKEEFLTISKVSAVGLLVIGAIGFVIAMAMGMFSIF